MPDSPAATPKEGARRLPVAVGSAAVLGGACAGVYALMLHGVGPLLGETASSAEIGGMWAVVATIFVYRSSVGEGVASALSRLAATAVSLVVCLAYLLVVPVSALGIGAVVAVGGIVAVLIGRPKDAALAGITSTVVLVVADLAAPAPGWVQPLLRLADTVVGMAAGLAAAGLLVALTARFGGRVRPAPPTHLPQPTPPEGHAHGIAH